MRFRSILVAVIAAMPLIAHAGDLTPQAASEVIDQIVGGLDTYIDPEVAKTVQARLLARRADYAKLDQRTAFAEAVSRDMFEASHDRHMKVSLETLSAQKTARLTEEQEALLDRRIAYGFMAARRLPGNIGYLKLGYFEQGEAGARLVLTLMGLLKDTDALIIDLRQNHGGGGVTETVLLGELSRARIPMAAIHWREAGGVESIQKREPRKPLEEPLYPDKPVFVLTANETFSAAEAFAYDLKAAHRAVLVGETTRGGANPQNRNVPLSYGFRVFIPNGKVVHPTTHANWDGVGVSPDVAVPREQALTEAYRRALALAKPTVVTPRSEAERLAAIADPRATLLADQEL